MGPLACLKFLASSGFILYATYMAGHPPNYKIVMTEDGSETLYSERFQETCHSTSGAKTETVLHYLQGCEIELKSKCHDPLIILEVGFGLGLGFLCTLEKLLHQEKKWHFLSVEIDRQLVEWFQSQHMPSLAWIDQMTLEMKGPKYTLTILVGDARTTLPQYAKTHALKWHAIYQDAFSHRRNPTLWTKEWFSFLKDHSSEDVVLSTYSSSSSVRKGLLEAGWNLHKGEKFGAKRASTRATLLRQSDAEILLHLQRSPVPALSDDNVEEFLRK